MSMLVLWIISWGFSLYIFLTDRKSVTMRWLSLFTFGAGAGGFATVWAIHVVPWTLEHYPDWYHLSLWVDGIFTSFAHYVAPYGLFVYGLYFFEVPRRYMIAWIAALMPLLMYVVYPIYPHFETSFVWLSLWAVPFISSAHLLMIWSYVREWDQKLKRNKLIACVILIPPTFSSEITNFVLRAFGIENAWQINGVVTALQFLLFCYVIVKYGAFGVRIRLEKERMDNNLKAIATSSSMLNHAIRNRLNIMDMSIEHIRLEAIQQNQPNIAQYADVALTELKQTQAMIQRIQKQMDDVHLVLKPVRMVDLLNRIIEGFSQLQVASRITVERNYAIDPTVVCDEVHVSETVLNIMKNAAEAMHPNGGIIRIVMEMDRKNLLISISDNGPGIKKEHLTKLFEPFFSTKKRNANFGLGLTYCYLVMQAHRGKIDITSSMGEGTTFMIRLPMKQIIMPSTSSESRVGQLGIR
jgi:signal transduction histidine kinase